jgi:hypothetical protein
MKRKLEVIVSDASRNCESMEPVARDGEMKLFHGTEGNKADLAKARESENISSPGGSRIIQAKACQSVRILV